MLKDVIIKFSAPICRCEYQEVGWSCPVEKTGTALTVTCKKCNVLLRIPHEEFRAQIVFEQPYPKGLAPKPNEPIEVVKPKDPAMAN